MDDLIKIRKKKRILQKLLQRISKNFIFILKDRQSQLYHQIKGEVSVRMSNQIIRRSTREGVQQPTNQGEKKVVAVESRTLPNKRRSINVKTTTDDEEDLSEVERTDDDKQRSGGTKKKKKKKRKKESKGRDKNSITSEITPEKENDQSGQEEEEHYLSDRRGRQKASRRRRRSETVQINSSNTRPNQQDRIRGDTRLGTYRISSDNDLFNTISTGKSSLEPTLEDWIEMYKGRIEDDEDSKGEALAVLINFFLRCCGCNSTIDKHQALDLDAVTDTLDTAQDDFKQVPNQAYPIVDRGPKSASKRFREQLVSLLAGLINLAHVNLILYDDYFMPSVQSYLVSMSSSTLRSFRHTSTFISLFGLIKSLCETLSSVKKELMILNRKIQAETNQVNQQPNGNKAKKNDRLLEWKSKKKQVHSQKVSIENYLNELLDGVFFHRYRDADSTIRAECVRALWQSMKIVPDFFLEGNYLRYIGWVLSESSKEVRNEGLNALCELYDLEENIGSMQSFTTRYRSRLIEIAIGETDLSSRCLSIHVLTLIDKHGLLESKQRSKLGRLIYHEEPKVRRATGEFFNNLLADAFESRKTRMNALNNSSSNSNSKSFSKNSKSVLSKASEKWLKLKCLARLLSRLGRGHDSDEEPNDTIGDEEQDSFSDEPSRSNDNIRELRSRDGIVSALTRSYPEKGRIALAIEDIWNKVEIAQDWRELSKYLLLDHTASNTAKTSGLSGIPLSQIQNMNNCNPEDRQRDNEEEFDEEPIGEDYVLDDGLKLTESEETILVEVLVASMRKFSLTLTPKEDTARRRRNVRRKKPEAGITDDEAGHTDAEAAERDDDGNAEETANKVELTRIMIDLLPKLWSKFSTDPIRLAEISRVPKFLSLNLYLDLRMVSAFEEMWDTLTKEYLKQQRMEAIQAISTAIDHVSTKSKSLKHISESKIKNLDDALMLNLLDMTEDKTDVETNNFEVDEVLSLTLLLIKIANLIRQRDLTDVLQSKLPSNRSSPLDVIVSLANRGRLEYESEARLVEVALEIIQLNFTWYSAGLCRMMNTLKIPNASDQANNEDTIVASRKSRLDRALAFRDVVISIFKDYAIESSSNACGVVKRAAFIHLINTFLLCQSSFMPEEIRLECDQQTQYRCAGFIQAEIENFIERDAKDRGGGGGGGSDDESLSSSQVAENQTNQTSNCKKQRKSLVNPKRAEKIPSAIEFQSFEEFDLAVTTFSKAIRCGLIQVRHSVVILPHYGRINKLYDSSVEVLISALNESFTQNRGDSGMLSRYVKEVLVESFELFLKGSVKTDEKFVSLSKLLQSVVIIRGPRLRILPRFSSESYLKLHCDCIDWFVKRLIQVDEQNQSDPRDRLCSFFKGLISLLIGVEPRTALKIKLEKNRLLESSDSILLIQATSWDSIKQYGKRLDSIISKDPKLRSEVTGKKKPSESKVEKDVGLTGKDVAREIVDGTEGEGRSQAGRGAKVSKSKRKSIRTGAGLSKNK
ncbi:expressed protein, partial [Phakopsora pachyrhizi]